MIKTIKFNDDHLGQLKLDFSRADGYSFKRIVIAGDNGSGKTTILNIISSYMSSGDMAKISSMSYFVDNCLYNSNKIPGANMGNYEFVTKDTGEQMGEIFNYGTLTSLINKPILRKCGYAYSKARSGFTMKKVDKIGTSDIDKENFTGDNDDYTDIKSLLIDIETMDNNNFKKFFFSNEGFDKNKIKEEFYKVSKVKRFKEAYEKFFPTIKYLGLSVVNEHGYEIVFKKNDKEIPIEKLSTGEQQIVCRGARMLKNVSNLQNSIILIDEPELSLHPTWQEKIYSYYCDLFSNNNCQLIFATHSEYVIKSALADPDCLVIILKEEQGTVVPHKITCPFILDSITPSEINYEAFGIYSIDYHIALYAKYQSKINKEKITETDASIEAESLYNPLLHEKISTFVYNGHTTTYHTLPTYIRNNIDHPNNGQPFTSDELKTSIDFLRCICM